MDRKKYLEIFLYGQKKVFRDIFPMFGAGDDDNSVLKRVWCVSIIEQ